MNEIPFFCHGIIWHLISVRSSFAWWTEKIILKFSLGMKEFIGEILALKFFQEGIDELQNAFVKLLELYVVLIFFVFILLRSHG